MNINSIIVDSHPNLTLRLLRSEHMVTFYNLVVGNKEHLRDWNLSANITDLKSCFQFWRRLET